MMLLNGISIIKTTILSLMESIVPKEVIGRIILQVLIKEKNTKEMLEEKKFSKFPSDVSLPKICSQLEYKASYYGKRYIKIDTYYPSSQECSYCGYKNEIVKDLSVRNWIYPECGSCHDRDINASKIYYLKE